MIRKNICFLYEDTENTLRPEMLRNESSFSFTTHALSLLRLIRIPDMFSYKTMHKKTQNTHIFELMDK